MCAVGQELTHIGWETRKLISLKVDISTPSNSLNHAISLEPICKILDPMTTEVAVALRIATDGFSSRHLLMNDLVAIARVSRCLHISLRLHLTELLSL